MIPNGFVLAVAGSAANMPVSGFEWVLVGAVGTLAIGVIAFFLKRTISRVDRNEGDISAIKLGYVTKEEQEKLKKALNKVEDELKGDIEKMESELKADIRRLNDSIGEIKEKVLYKTDFIRSMADLNRSIEKLHDLYIEDKRGGSAGGH